ncbi:MAG: BamA/TamA family outer membrane protein [Bacteroidales bacterium]|nr:BamA/TamA family outer membrane protein [Bacteroidales bacterium]
MQRNLLFSIFLFISLTLSAEETVKRSYNLGVLPAVSYNSDLGLQYGALINLFNYGDGSKYPEYNLSAYMEISTYTKGSGIYRLYFDSNKLIPGIRSFIELGYLTDYLMNFYGFNGYKSYYSSDIQDDNRVFYKMSQKQIRLLADFKGELLTDHLSWTASYNFENYKNSSVDYEQLNEDVDPNDPDYLQGVSLYDKYVNWGLIRPEEANGGILNTLKAGLIYDTRNALNNPGKGSYTEAILEVAPAFMNDMPYTRYSLIHCQYKTIIKDKLNAAVRLGIQGKIGDREVPFFRRTQLMSPFAKRTNVTGLGGSNSLRGILRNRVVGDAFSFGNFELRWKTVSFRWINQNFYVGLNGFFDTGIILDPIDWNLENLSNTEDLATYVKVNEKDCFHSSYGGGIKLAMNENFIISVELGKALDKRDGDDISSYINLNYLF